MIYREIQRFLRAQHKESLSVSTTKRLSRKFNLFRLPIERIWTDNKILLADVRDFIVVYPILNIRESGLACGKTNE